MGPYTTTGQVNACPDFHGPTGAGSRPFNGYAYNATYLGGDWQDTNYSPSGIPPCTLSQIASPAKTAAFTDGGYGTIRPQPENFLRAPSDSGGGLFSAGLVDFRHNSWANVAYADGHVRAVQDKFPYKSKYPEFGALSPDDSAYDLN